MGKQKSKEKNIIISAAADGIGWCIANHCVDNGYTVYLSDINKKKIEEIKEHPQFNKKIFIDFVDAKRPDLVEEYFNSLKNKISNIDGLINNVGLAGPTGTLESLSESDWKETLDTNVNSHFYFTKHAIPMLKSNKNGSIINISSTAGLFGFPLRTPYAASKWAIIGITKSLAMELGEFNIRVNAICPGSVWGDRMKRVIQAKAKSTGVPETDLQQDYESMVSLKTFVNKEDIANMALYLLSNKSKNISGQIMTVDGNTERMY